MGNKLNNIYKCELCGNMVEMTHVSGGELVCCGKPMNILAENTTDAATEKHVPVVTKNGNTIEVRVGEVSHPMEEKHYIEWIELLTDNEVHRKYLHPGEEPIATFNVNATSFSVREYCNLHGLWKA